MTSRAFEDTDPEDIDPEVLDELLSGASSDVECAGRMLLAASRCSISQDFVESLRSDTNCGSSTGLVTECALAAISDIADLNARKDAYYSQLTGRSVTSEEAHLERGQREFFNDETRDLYRVLDSLFSRIVQARLEAPREPNRLVVKMWGELKARLERIEKKIDSLKR